MRKPVAASAAGCLLAALIAIPPPVAAADPVPGEYLNQPLARLISQSNGTTGWAATNAANLSAQGYDPASVGRAYAPQAGHDHVTTSIAADGKSATVKVSECCGEWEVGSVLADADGTATVALQNEFTTDPDEFLLTFDESTPDLVTVDMLVESLLPIITFTVVVREKDGDQPDPDKDKLSTWGHYALNLVDGTIEDDDSTTRTPPNGHSTYRALGNPQVLSRRLKKSTVFAQAVADIKATAMTQAAADVSKGIQTLLEGYANTMRWAQEIDVPYSFGYAPAGLGNGDEATFTVQGAAAQDSWLSDLSTRVEDVPVSFQSTDLSGLVTDRMAQATAGTSLGSALAQLGEGLSYPKFAAGIDCWATPNCAPEGVPSLEDTIQWAMIDEYKKGIQAGLEQASRIQWDLGAVDDEGQPEDSEYYAIVTFDNILGETTFSGRGMNSLSPFNFYPAAKFDARLAKQIADFIRSSTGLGQPWAPVIEEHLSGTADLVATFDPGRITRVYPTGVDDSTGLAPIAPLSLSTLDSMALAPSMANLRPGATATYTFTSDDPRIASVDGSGVVRAVAEGATTIQVRASVSCPQETRPVTYDLWVDVSVTDVPRPQGVLTVAPVTARTVGTGAPSVFTATATVYDSESSANGGRGDLMPGQQVNFTLVGASAGQPALSAQTCTTGALGTCSVSLTSTLAGTFQLSATTGPKTLTGSPLVLTWNRGDPAPATSSLSVSPASVTAGGSATATVAVRDAFGNPATGLTLAGLGLSSAPAGLSFTNARETTPGIYSVTVTGTKAGAYAVEAKQPSATLSGTLTVTPGAAAAVVLAVDPGVAATGTQTVATAAVVDAHHNTVTGLDAGAFALDPGGLTIVSGPAAGAAGAYTWTLTSAAAGTYGVSVAARGFSDAQSVRYVVGAPGHIELAAANATSEASVASGAKATATVTVTDQAGAKNDDLTESDFTWTFTRVNQATGAAEATTEVHPAAFTRNPDGTYTWRLWATKAGTYQATVLAKGTADPDGLNQQAYTFTAGPPTTATLSLAVDSGPINAPVAATFVIRDNLGNGIGVTPAGLAAAYSSTPAGLAAEAWTQATDAYGNPTGVYRSNVEATAPGEYTARIGLPGAPAAADTIRLTQSVGTVALAVGPADHVVSDADGAGVTATVTVAGDGSPVAGLQAEDFGWGVTLQGKSSAAVKVKPGSFHETAPGTYEALLHSETAGAFQVTATAGGKTSSARALAFDPGPADAARSTWTIAPSTVALPENGSAGQATGTFVLADSFGNVISGQGANIALVPDGPGVLTPAGPAVQADQPGTYQWKLSTVTAGEYTVTAIHPTIGSKTATVRFTGFIPSPANSSFTIDPPSVATSDPAGAQATATLMVRDSDNQPIPGMAAGDISVTSTPAGLLLAPNTFQETAPGLYIFKVHSNQPAVYDVVAQAFGVPFADAADHATLTVTAAPSTARATVTKDGAQANGADQGIITVAVGDAWGNPVAGVTPTATAADLARFGDVEPTGADGTTTIAYTSVRPGGHAVEVTVPGVAQVTGSPVRLNFGAACLPGIDDGCAPIDGKALPHVEVTADGAVAEGTALNSVKAVIADQQGNPVAGLLVRASLDGGDVTTRQTGADGAAEFSFASFQSGPRQAVVEVYSTGQWRPVAVAVDPAPDETWLSSPVTLTFSHLPPDPVLSDVSVVGGAATINQRASFTVRATVHDGNDQSLAGVRVDFTADPPVELSADSCETGSTGSCSIQASSDDPATTRVAATVGGAAVRNSPVTLTWVYSPLVPAPQPTILEPASDRPIDDGAVTVRGTGQSGLTVTVSSDGAEVCRATVEADDTWACQAGSPLAHGEHVLEAVQTSPDPDTSPSSPASRVIIIDTVPPEPPVISAPAAGATTREATVNVTGTAEAGSSVTVVEGPDTILAAARANPNWGGPSPALADGEHTFTATATDEAGNTSEAATVTFTVKATPPAVAVASPFDGQTDLTARPEFSGQTDPGVLVTVAESGATLCEATADPAGAWACAPSADLALGPHTVTVTGVDPAGNPSTPVTRLFHVGPGPLAAPRVLAPADGATVQTPRPTFSGDGAAAGNQVRVASGRDDTLCTTTADADGTWSCQAQADVNVGQQTIRAYQSSASETSGARTITITVVAPGGPTVLLSEINQLAKTKTGPAGLAHFGGTVAAPATVTVTDSGGTVLCATTTATTTWRCDTTTGLASGNHQITVTASDDSGLGRPDWGSLDIDLAAPDAPQITAPPNGTVQTDSKQLAFAGTAEPGATVAVETASGLPLCSRAADSSGAWACATANLSDAAYDVAVTAVDPWNNTSTPTLAHYEIDVMPPEAPAIETPAQDARIDQETAFPLTLSGTGGPGEHLLLTTAAAEPPAQPDAWKCQTDVAADGTWSCDVTDPLPVGEATFTIVAWDRFDRYSPETTVGVTVYKRSTKPEPPVVTEPGDQAEVTDTTPEITGTGEDVGYTVEVTVLPDPDNGQYYGCSAVVLDDLTWSCTITDELPDNAAYRVTAEQTSNRSGLTSDAASLGFTIPSLTTPSQSSSPSAGPSSAGPSPSPTADPSSQGPSPSPSVDPSSQGPSPSPSVDPSSDGPSPSPSVDPSSVDPSSDGPSPSPSVDPSSDGPSPSPSVDPSSDGPSPSPSVDPSSDGPSPSPSVGPSSATPSVGFCAAAAAGLPDLKAALGGLTAQSTTQEWVAGIADGLAVIDDVLASDPPVAAREPLEGFAAFLADLSAAMVSQDLAALLALDMDAAETSLDEFQAAVAADCPAVSPSAGQSSASPSVGPSSDGPSPSPSVGPSSASPSTSPSSESPSVDPSSDGPSPSPSVDPSSDGPSPSPSVDPSSDGPSPSPSVGPSSQGPSPSPSVGPSSGSPSDGPSPSPSVGPSSGSPSVVPSSGSPSGVSPSSASPSVSPSPPGDSSEEPTPSPSPSASSDDGFCAVAARELPALSDALSDLTLGSSTDDWVEGIDAALEVIDRILASDAPDSVVLPLGEFADFLDELSDAMVSQSLEDLLDLDLDYAEESLDELNVAVADECPTATSGSPRATLTPSSPSAPTDPPSSPSPSATSGSPTVASPSPGGTPTDPPPTSQPPTSEPPTSQPPTSQPPTSQPPTSQPPTSQPPTSQPPTSEPPTSQPPTSEPPTSQPPTSQPPTSEPPTSQPPTGTPTPGGQTATAPATSSPTQAVAPSVASVTGGGRTYTVVGAGFQPGESVSATLHPDQLALGTATADSTGKVTFTTTLPATLAAGTHKVVLVGALSGTTEKSFQVTADGSLALTGPNPLALSLGLGGLVALGLAAAGLGLARARRREGE